MIVIDTGSAVPVFEQIREQVLDLVRSAQLAAGDRLPSIRQLAGDLRIAPGTVARAYAELEAIGVITSSRTGGTRIVGDHAVADDVLRAAAELSRVARRHALGLGDALGAVRATWSQS